MNLLTSVAVPLLRGAAVAALVAGLADGWTVALGVGADLRSLALGTLLLAIGWGACRRGAAPPAIRASYLWLLAGGCALPMLAGWAPWTGVLGAVFVLPLRMLGVRLAAQLESAENPAAALGAMTFGALLGLAWVAGAGLGLGGFVLAAVVAGFATVAAPPAHAESPGLDRAPWSRVTQSLAGMALGAGATWSFVLLAPLVRVHDASDAGADARALLAFAALALLAWLTLGAFVAERRNGATLAALAALAAAFALPLAVENWLAISEPASFDALLRQPMLRSLLRSEAPRLADTHAAFAPLMVAVGAGLPILLLATALRGWLGRRPDGPLRLAPALIGAGFALVVAALPLLDGDAGALRIGCAAACALLLAALGMLVAADGSLIPRAAIAAAALIASIWLLRAPPPLQPAFAIQDARDWSVGASAAGAPLHAASREALWRVVGVVEQDGARVERLARGRNLLTPALDAEGGWTREVEVALTIRRGAQRMLFAGAPHPASLRAAARGGVVEASFAGDAAAARLLVARDPEGYGLAFGHASSIARAPGRWDLILLRADAPWDEDLPILRAGVAAQAAHRLAPGGFCLLTLAPEQLAPGVLPGVLAAWRGIFPRVTLYALPDGLRGVRLIVAAAMHREGEWPASLAALQVPAPEVAEIVRGGGRALLGPPLPRAYAALAGAVPRLADPFAPVRRAAEVLAELAPPTAGEERGPSLLHAYALHYAAQEYSTHDTHLTPGADAIEVREAPLQELLALARAHPDSRWLRAAWSDAADVLAAKREVAMAEEFLRPLREQLGWRESAITLALARAAAEQLDEEEARALLAEVLAAEPGLPAALALQQALDGGGLAPDPHAQHGHD